MEHMDVDAEIEFERLDQAQKEKLRNDEIDKLVAITKIIMSKLPDCNRGMIITDKGEVTINIDVSNQISGVLATVYTFLRKSDKNNTSNTADRYKVYEAKIGDRVIKIEDLANNIHTAKLTPNFLIATPIMDLLTSFKCSFDEVRTGVTKFPIKDDARRAPKRKATGQQASTSATPAKRKEDLKYKNLSDYGLNNQHIPLLQGVTFPPERRTGVLRSLGPMTQAILMVNETKYFNKLTKAMQNSLQMLPMKEEVILALRNATSPGSVAGLLKELGDLLILSTARATQKIFYPLLLWVFIWENKTDKITFSGAKTQYELTKFVRDFKGKFEIKTSGSTEHMAQIVFHAMFGTHLDDLGVLPQITNNGEWNKRAEMTSVFIKRATAETKSFRPIHLTKYSKMAQALQTKTLGNIEPTSTCRPSFSGARKRIFTSEFRSYLKTGKSLSTFSTDLVSLQYAIRSLKDGVIKDMDNDSIIMAGTTSWCTEENGVLVDVDNFRVEEKGEYFYGSAD